MDILARMAPVGALCRRGLLFVFVLGCALGLALGQPRHLHAQESVHTVSRGENLYRIAAQYQVSIGELIRVNQIQNPNRIWVGQRLIIPARAKPQTARSTPVATPQPVLLATTTLGATATPTPVFPRNAVPFAYTVRSGDTLAAIAARFGCSIHSLKARNNLRANILFVGQRLIIPSPE